MAILLQADFVLFGVASPGGVSGENGFTIVISGNSVTVAPVTEFKLGAAVATPPTLSVPLIMTEFGQGEPMRRIPVPGPAAVLIEMIARLLPPPWVNVPPAVHGPGGPVKVIGANAGWTVVVGMPPLTEVHNRGVAWKVYV